MPVSIIYNASSVNSRNNLVAANQGIETSVKRLSSGMRIARASDDVGGLAVGTQLQSNVIVLKAAANNVQQANSLLAVADGALDNIVQMLQRMLSLSSQATSAALNDASRAYLNQEFQGLKSEIDRVSNYTKFNGINLIDGTFGQAAVYNNLAVNDIATIAQNNGKSLAALDIAKSFISTDPHTIADLRVPLSSIQLSNGAVAPTAGNLGAINIQYAASGSTWSVVIGALTYSGSVSNSLDSLGTAVLTDTGGSGKSVVVTNASASAIDIKTQSDADQMAHALVYAFGAPAYATGMDAANVANTAGRALAPLDLIGKPNRIADLAVNGSSFTLANGGTPPTGGLVGSFNIKYNAANSIWSVVVGAKTYQGAVSNTLATGATTNLTATDGSGEILVLKNTHVTIDFNVSSQSDANQLSQALEYAFTGITYATGMDAANIAATNNKNLASMDLLSINPKVLDMSTVGSSLQFSGNSASGTIDDFRITYANTSSIWNMVVGGVAYSGSVDNNLRANGTATLNAVDGSGQSITLTNKTARSMVMDSQVEADRVLAALNDVVKGSVIFQVGTISSDQVLVGLSGNSSALLGIAESVIDSVGAPTSTSSATAATLAVDKVTQAIQTALSNRAIIGAFTSRFDKAFNAISTSAQNQDAARGVYLDADIAEESSNLAAGQVKMNASISVLAQANELTKSLLKLLG